MYGCNSIEEIAKACTLTARIVVEANMGGISAIMAYGSKFQKDFCAPIVLAGDKPAICITEPEAGSAATDMQTTARKYGDTYILNGTKHKKGNRTFHPNLETSPEIKL